MLFIAYCVVFGIVPESTLVMLMPVLKSISDYIAQGEMPITFSQVQSECIHMVPTLLWSIF